MIQKVFHGFKYQYDKVDGFHIVTSDDLRRPSTFFKYYALTEYSVDALTKMYLYASHPNQFNDPLDCAEELIIFDDDDVICTFWDSLYPSVLTLCKNNEKAIMEFTRKAYKTYIYMKWGVVCLSTNPLDISMWAAYTNHNGFCVELDLSDFPHKSVGPYPVNYLDTLESISLEKESIQLATIIQTNVKADCWEHEHEWRLLLECPANNYMEPFGDFESQFKDSLPVNHNRKFNYSMNCIKSVCLGKDFFNDENIIATNGGNEFLVNDKLKNELLSFLALSKIQTYVIDSNNLKIVKVPFKIFKTRKDAYRIEWQNQI